VGGAGKWFTTIDVDLEPYIRTMASRALTFPVDEISVIKNATPTMATSMSSSGFRFTLAPNGMVIEASVSDKSPKLLRTSCAQPFGFTRLSAIPGCEFSQTEVGKCVCDAVLGLRFSQSGKFQHIKFQLKLE